MDRRRLMLLTLLTFGTGAMDAIAFLALGGVFVSVMTGNLVLLGLGVNDRHLAVRCALAIGAYVVGAGIGVRLARRSDDPGPLPSGVETAIGFELACIAIFTVMWELAGGTPDAAWRIPLIAVAGIAMGVRSAAIRTIPGMRLSTTYLSGLFTAMIDDAVTAGPTPRLERGLWIVVAVVLGALTAGLLLDHVPRVAPFVPLAVLLVVFADRRATST